MAVMNDGFSTTITLGGDATLYLVLPEKEVTPPGMDRGGPIPVSTMRNTYWRTFAPKSLTTMTPIEFTAAYDSDVWLAGRVANQLGVIQLCGVRYPNGRIISIYGWLDKFQPNAHKEGEQPTANCTFQPSNMNGVGVEAGPIYT